MYLEPECVTEILGYGRKMGLRVENWILSGSSTSVPMHWEKARLAEPMGSHQARGRGPGGTQKRTSQRLGGV